MITCKVEGLKSLEVPARLAKEHPTMLRNAINDTAFETRKREMDAAQESFISPRPQTVKNFFVKKATRESLSAEIFFDQIYGKGYDEYMVPQVKGGARIMKKSEKLLGRYFVPGAGAQIDQYGNMKGSQIVQILSQLGQMKESGFNMNRRKKMSQVAGPRYFMLTKAKNGLPAGVFMRVDKSQGQMLVARALANRQRGEKKSDIKAQYKQMLERGVIPVMIFVDRPPTYRKRFPFFEVAEKTANECFPKFMEREAEFATRRLQP